MFFLNFYELFPVLYTDSRFLIHAAMTFKRNVPLEWVDPENWSSQQVNLATPHAERIPCEHDTVVFDPGHSFSVVVPDLPINIGSVKYGNQVSIPFETDYVREKLEKPNFEMF